MIFVKHLRVRDKFNQCTVFFFSGPFVFFYQHTSLELGGGKVSVPKRRYPEIFGQRVYRLGTNTVESDRKLKYIGIVLCSGINDRYTLNELSKRNPRPKSLTLVSPFSSI